MENVLQLKLFKFLNVYLHKLISKYALTKTLNYFSNLTARLRRRRSSVELAMNIYPGDLLVQEHHKRLLKRNTVADFNTLRNGSSQSISDGLYFQNLHNM